MNNMENKKKIDDQIMKKLDANTIRRPICLTNKGALELVIVKGGNEYYLTLDSVPVEKELNRELMDILFKPEVPKAFDGYVDARTPEERKADEKITTTYTTASSSTKPIMITLPKKGRPAKVK